MLTSFALIFLFALTFGAFSSKLRLPTLVGMLAAGMLLGPYGLNWLDPQVLDISAPLRQLALVIILTRAGLALKLDDLKSIGRPALLLSFLPATVEILGIALIAPKLLGISLVDALLLGSVVAAVSPAVVVPRMLSLIERGFGVKKRIPQMVLAGASVDDVFVIVLFSTFLHASETGTWELASLFWVPVSIVLGVAVGFLCGWLLVVFFKRYHMRDSIKVLLMLSLSFLLLELETQLKAWVSFSALLSIMSLSMAILYWYPELAKRLSAKYNKLWVAAEPILFVLVAAIVNPSFAVKLGPVALLVIFGALLFRMAGVGMSIMGTDLNVKERLFTAVSYTPKATVQAAIGGVPLAMGLASGEIILTLAVVAILVTAPLGAFGVDLLYEKCLDRGESL